MYNILSFNTKNLEMHCTGRYYDFDIVASLLSEKSLCKRRGNRYKALFQVGFALRNNRIDLFHIVLHVFDCYFGEEKHFRSVDF